ncbi:DUF4139 domain-containing protein, partial [bacterium]|nr:DUF4139 domain-containing protein [bacterium]
TGEAIATQGASLDANGNYATSFDIEARQDLPSDGRNRRLRITAVDLEGKMRHECVPKRSSLVYLVAAVRNGPDFPLLAGTTRILLGGNYLGRGAIRNIAPGEEFDLALGVDAAVTVDRTMVRRRNDSSGSQWESEVAWDLRVSNHRREPVRVTLRDQLPISPDEDVSVRLRDVTPRTTGDPDIDGALEWKLAIPAGEERTASFRYEVKYPSNRRPRNL